MSCECWLARSGAIPFRVSLTPSALLTTALIVLSVLTGPVQAQRQAVIVQDVLIQGDEMVDLVAGAQPANTKAMLLKQMRGLIQNELSIVADVCGLIPKQQQSLADLAESEWKAKTNASIIKRSQENVYGMIDLDGLAERLVRTWLETVASADQLGKYDEEMVDRMQWRKKAVVSKMLDTLEAKLNLSGIQMKQIDAKLNEVWKDRFYRSLEATFDNPTLLPDIRPSWISEFLSESQRAALVTRDSQPQRFIQGVLDSPSQALDVPFKVGNTFSSELKESEESNDQKKSPIDAIREKAKVEDEGVIDAKKP